MALKPNCALVSPGLRYLFIAVSSAALGGCATDVHIAGDPDLVYLAQGDVGSNPDWQLRITSRSVRFRNTIGPEHYGDVPRPQVRSDGVTYEGELVETMVVAGLIEESRMNYRLDIAPGPCRDRLRRVWPTHAIITFSPEFQLRGCGGSMPALDHSLPVE